MIRGWCRRVGGRGRADVGEGVDGLHDAGVGGVVEGVDPVADFVDDVDLPVVGHHALSVPIAILARRRGRTGLPGSGRSFSARCDRRMDTGCKRNVPSVLDEWTTQSRRRSSRAGLGARRADGLRFAFYGRMSTTEYQDRASSRAWQREAADRERLRRLRVNPALDVRTRQFRPRASAARTSMSTWRPASGSSSTSMVVQSAFDAG